MISEGGIRTFNCNKRCHWQGSIRPEELNRSSVNKGKKMGANTESWGLQHLK